jgi:UDP-N-acetyl-D-mannosaminuronic acid dehydrogenase
MLVGKVNFDNWRVSKIGVIGPGIVGMPMAALLAHAKVKIGQNDPAKVVIVQRNSVTSGWKVEAINQGKSVIGGIEPSLDRIVEESVRDGILSASYHYSDLRDADVILVCVQTDKDGFRPDYGPMFEALTGLAETLQHKPDNKKPLIIFESTLAPSSMATLMKEHFKEYGLVEGEDILLGNSPNRVMPGRLVERVKSSDKIVAGLQPETPQLIRKLYSYIVTDGTLYPTNSLTAEVVKTLENAYRDVRIAFSAEVVRYCDLNDINFYDLRESVNQKLSQSDSASKDPNTVPSGGLLIPTVGVGGHCLPKDGILLWWRRIESGDDTSNSLILKSREINDASPLETLRLAEREFGKIDGKKVALLGAAYRFNSEDTRNSPTLVLAKILQERGCQITIHDPYVKINDQNILKYKLESVFTQNLAVTLKDAEIMFFCTAHKIYMDKFPALFEDIDETTKVCDACNLFDQSYFSDSLIKYAGIGKGKKQPLESFINYVYQNFRAVEIGVANEVKSLTKYLNTHYADSEFNRIDFRDVQKLAASCNTGCVIENPDDLPDVPAYDGFSSQLVSCAHNAIQKSNIEI